MEAISKAIYILQKSERKESANAVLPGIGTGARLIVTVAYLVAMLSVSLENPIGLLLFAVYPMTASTILGINYWKIVKYSFVAVPIIALVAIFNPLLDHSVAFTIGSIKITRGWAMFASILIRGVLALQGVMVLIAGSGFHATCSAMRKLCIPAFFSTLLLVVYRYLIVLLEELQSMDRARRSRGYGNKHYSIKIWAALVGQLLLRSIDRASRINMAMQARGFNGSVPTLNKEKWGCVDTIYTFACIVAFISVRLYC